MAECLALWLLAGRFKLAVEMRPRGRDERVLEFLIQPSGTRVEVKAPFRARPIGAFSGEDSDLIERVLEDANDQFSEAVPNLAVLVPGLRSPIYHDRGQLTRALCVASVLRIDVPASEFDSVQLEYRSTGRLMRRPRQQPGASPNRTKSKLTRTSAVLSVEEVVRQDPSYWIDHEIFVVHNPNAQVRIDLAMFDGVPQFFERKGTLQWTDGHLIV